MDTRQLRTINPIRALIVGILPILLYFGLSEIWPRWSMASLLLGLALAAVLVSFLFMRRGREAVLESVVAASVNTVIVAVIVLFVGLRDSGLYVLLLVAVPLVAVIPLVLITLRDQTPRVATLIAAVVVIGWGIMHGLGIGFYFIIPGLSLLIAATTAFLNQDNHVMRY
ncbi:MAG: hypothetical protein QM705_03625 [Ancrocorticia sp.]